MKPSSEAASVQIVEYAPQWKAAFKDLNEVWIKEYFYMEPEDYEVLDHPEEHILNPGGAILMALLDGKAVGTCALIKMENQTWELAKMGVAPEWRGHGIGWALGKASIEKAKELGAKTIYLGSNSQLQPAIRMYEKLGFHHVQDRPTAYARCNVQMEMELS